MLDGLPSGWRDFAASWAAGKDRIHELHLFGSRAKGGFLNESDVDLAYVLTGSDPDEVFEFAILECDEWEAELEKLLNALIQLHWADPDTDLIVWPAVCEHGQLIYRKAGYLPVRV